MTYFFHFFLYKLSFTTAEEILAYNCKSALTGKVIPTSILQDPNNIVENLHYDEYINVLGFNWDYYHLGFKTNIIYNYF